MTTKTPATSPAQGNTKKTRFKYISDDALEGAVGGAQAAPARRKPDDQQDVNAAVGDAIIIGQGDDMLASLFKANAPAAASGPQQPRGADTAAHSPSPDGTDANSSHDDTYHPVINVQPNAEAWMLWKDKDAKPGAGETPAADAQAHGDGDNAHTPLEPTPPQADAHSATPAVHEAAPPQPSATHDVAVPANATAPAPAHDTAAHETPAPAHSTEPHDVQEQPHDATPAAPPHAAPDASAHSGPTGDAGPVHGEASQPDHGHASEPAHDSGTHTAPASDHAPQASDHDGHAAVPEHSGYVPSSGPPVRDATRPTLPAGKDVHASATPYTTEHATPINGPANADPAHATPSPAQASAEGPRASMIEIGGKTYTFSQAMDVNPDMRNWTKAWTPEDAARLAAAFKQDRANPDTTREQRQAERLRDQERHDERVDEFHDRIRASQQRQDDAYALKEPGPINRAIRGTPEERARFDKSAQESRDKEHADWEKAQSDSRRERNARMFRLQDEHDESQRAKQQRIQQEQQEKSDSIGRYVGMLKEDVNAARIAGDNKIVRAPIEEPDFDPAHKASPISPGAYQEISQVQVVNDGDQFSEHRPFAAKPGSDTAQEAVAQAHGAEHVLTTPGQAEPGSKAMTPGTEPTPAGGTHQAALHQIQQDISDKLDAHGHIGGHGDDDEPVHFTDEDSHHVTDHLLPGDEPSTHGGATAIEKPPVHATDEDGHAGVNHPQPQGEAQATQPEPANSITPEHAQDSRTQPAREAAVPGLAGETHDEHIVPPPPSEPSPEGPARIFTPPAHAATPAAPAHATDDHDEHFVPPPPSEPPPETPQRIFAPPPISTPPATAEGGEAIVIHPGEQDPIEINTPAHPDGAPSAPAAAAGGHVGDDASPAPAAPTDHGTPAEPSQPAAHPPHEPVHAGETSHPGTPQENQPAGEHESAPAAHAGAESTPVAHEGATPPVRTTQSSPARTAQGVIDDAYRVLDERPNPIRTGDQIGHVTNGIPDGEEPGGHAVAGTNTSHNVVVNAAGVTVRADALAQAEAGYTVKAGPLTGELDAKADAHASGAVHIGKGGIDVTGQAAVEASVSAGVAVSGNLGHGVKGSVGVEDTAEAHAQAGGRIGTSGIEGAVAVGATNTTAIGAGLTADLGKGISLSNEIHAGVVETATAAGHAGVGMDGFGMGSGAVAGSYENIGGSITVGNDHYSGTAGGDLHGPGAFGFSEDASANFHDGKVTLNLSGDIDLGLVGFNFHLGATLDVAGVEHSAEHAIASAASDLGGYVKEAAVTVEHAFVTAGKAIEHGFEDAGNAIVKWFRSW